MSRNRTVRKYLTRKPSKRNKLDEFRWLDVYINGNRFSVELGRCDSLTIWRAGDNFELVLRNCLDVQAKEVCPARIL